MKCRQPMSVLFAVGIALSVTGCGSGDKKQQGAGTAGGEVLPAAASDAMLPFDTVKSQAPLAPKSAESGEKKTAKSTTSADGGATGQSAETAAGDPPQQD